MSDYKLAFTWFSWIVIEKSERERFKDYPGMLIKILYHEQSHASRPWVIPLTKRIRQREELRAEKDAYKKMILLGYTHKDFIKMIIDYRVWDKYGLALEDFEKAMEEKQ